MKPSNIKLTLSYILLIVLAIAALYPALFTIMSSLNPGDSLYSSKLFSKHMTLDHYKALFNPNGKYQVFYVKWYWNTLIIAIVSMIVGTFIQLFTAYALSRFRFRGRKMILTVTLVLTMFPGFMSMIAIYIMLIDLHLLDTLYALMLVYAAGAALQMYVAKGYFDTLPKSLEESARIDGASHMRIFFNIMLPLSKPIIVYIALTTFYGAFVDFIFAALILRSRDHYTLAVGLFQLVQNNTGTQYTLFAAGSVLIAVPITILFLFLQRFIIEGLTAGAMKG